MEYLHQSKGFDETVLRRQYGYFKEKPAKTFVETTVKLVTQEPGAFLPSPSNQQGSWDTLSAPNDITTERYLTEYLEPALRSSSPNPCLQICFLTLDFRVMQRHFSIWQNAIETFRGCQPDLNLAPARIIAQRLASAWNLQSIIKSPTSHLTSDCLPSRKLSLEVGILPKSIEETYTLHWQSKLLMYTNDLNVYVWQPHLEQTPSICYNSATIIMPSKLLGSHSGVSSANRILVIADPPSLMARFLSSEDAFVKSSQTQHKWDTDHETLRVLAVFFKWIVDDSSVLVDEIASRTTDMMYKGRSLPTRSKIQYLVHLDDCRRLAIADLQHAGNIVDRARLTVASADFCCQQTGDSDKTRALEVFTNCRADFEYLIDKLMSLKKPISSAKEQIIEQMGLAQGQRALVLTIAAAFFIPISFVASIFGMNVKDPLFPHVSNKKGHTPRTPKPTSTNTRAQTPAPTADSSGLSPHYWTMSQYLEISLPLTMAVILLPLIAGPCFRYASQQYEVHRRYWRALFVVFVILYFIGAVVMAVNLAYRRTSYTDSEIWEIAYLVWCYSVPGALCVVRVVTAYRQKQGRLRWSTQLLIYAVCLVLDVIYIDPVSADIPFALVLFLFMVLMSRTGVRWLKQGWTWVSWKTRRQSATRYSTITAV